MREKRGRITVGFFCLLLLSSCATLPKWDAGKWMALLPPDCSAYFTLDFTPLVGDIANIVLGTIGDKSADTTELVKRTDRVYGAVRLTAQGEMELHAAIVGDFPATLLSLGLGSSEQWQRESQPREHWISNSGNLQIYLPQNSVVLLSTTDILPMIRNFDTLPAGPSLPDVVVQDMDSSELVAFLPDFSERSFAASMGLKLPIREILVTARQGETDYSVGGVFGLESESGAKKFNSALRVMLVYLLRKGAIEGFSKKLKNLDLVQRGSNIKVTGLSLTPSDISGILVSLLAGEG